MSGGIRKYLAAGDWQSHGLYQYRSKFGPGNQVIRPEGVIWIA